jgi:hypothetical protein
LRGRPEVGKRATVEPKIDPAKWAYGRTSYGRFCQDRLLFGGTS